MPEVVVYLLEGRSLEQKRGLVKDITQAVVKNAGTTADQVTVSLVETPRTAKAKGGVLFSEMAGRWVISARIMNRLPLTELTIS